MWLVAYNYVGLNTVSPAIIQNMLFLIMQDVTRILRRLRCFLVWSKAYDRKEICLKIQMIYENSRSFFVQLEQNSFRLQISRQGTGKFIQRIGKILDSTAGCQGFYEYCRLPMGLCNSRVTFQRMVHWILELGSVHVIYRRHNPVCKGL